MKLYIQCADNAPETFTISEVFGKYSSSGNAFWIPLSYADRNEYSHSIPLPVSQITITRDHTKYIVTIPKWLLKKNNIPAEFKVYTQTL